MSTSVEQVAGLNISAVERETGLSKDVLRVWERRYGYPQPRRDAHGERVYPPEQVARLRVIRRLLDAGMRPARLISLPLDELEQLAAAGAPPLREDRRADASAEVVRLLRVHDVVGLQQCLAQWLMRQGLQRFVQETVAPLTRGVGEAWMRGELQVFEEHLYTEAVQTLLRSAIPPSPPTGDKPRVLLTTLPDEPHGIGLLMVEALFAAEGVHCVCLGTQTPVNDIGLAAHAHRVHIIALSFSGAFPLRLAGESLAFLRRQVPMPVEIWAGGEMTRRLRRAVPGLRVITELAGVLPALQAWQAAHSPADLN